MKKFKIGRKLISFIVVCIMAFLAVGCNATNEQSKSESGGGGGTTSTSPTNSVDIEDSFIKLEFLEQDMLEVQVIEIDIEELQVESIEVDEITNLELDVITINDEFIYLAYQNFVSYYGEDFDLGEFLLDMGIGVTAVAICVGLSTVGGLVGTFFSGVILSEFSIGATVVSLAIDMAIEGYKAYEEGGDASYIVGHMINGAADGFRFGAILAPVTGLTSGRRALKAVKAVQQMSNFANFTTKQINNMLQHTPDIIKHSAKLADNVGDAVIKQAYKEFSQSVSKQVANEITEEMFSTIFKNKKLWLDNILKYDPFGVSSQTIKQLKKSFFRKANVSEEVSENILKKIQNKTINSINDFTQYSVKDFVESNYAEFLELFGKQLSDKFINEAIENTIGSTVNNAIKKALGKNTNFYTDILQTISKSEIDSILSNYKNLLLLQAKYGSSKLNKLLSYKNLYNSMLKNNDISASVIAKVIDGILDGSIKNLDDVSKINTQIAKNMKTSGEVISQNLKNLGKGVKSQTLLNELAQSSIKNRVNSSLLTDNTINDILTNSLKKTDIVQKYGNATYQEMVDKIDCVMPALKTQAKLNNSLVNSLFSDYLAKKSIDTTLSKKIIKGVGIENLGIENLKLKEIANVVAEYYRITDYKVYKNFVKEFAEIRCVEASRFNKSIGYTPVNGEYASKLKPTTNDYIKAKYGDIYYNSAGYPIFDEHAIARIELLDLTGLNGGMDDIKRANLLHHGTQDNVPGYTWHHVEDGKTLILVPTELHNAAVSGYGHSGGAKLLRDGAFGVR